MAVFVGYLLGFYALLMAIGGVMGYVTSKSTASLIAGLVSGIALLGAWWVAGMHPARGFGLAAVIALALLVIFANRYRKTQKVMPSLMLCIVSLCAVFCFASTAFLLHH